MTWDDDYSDGYLLEEDEISLVEDGQGEEFFPEGLYDDLDYERYEEEKEEVDHEDFPESYEEWKLMKKQERWEREQEALDRDLIDYEG